MTRQQSPRQLLTLWLPTVAVSVVVGMALGGLGPRAQVRELRERVVELEARPRDRVGSRLFSEVLRPGATERASAPPSVEQTGGAEAREPSPSPETPAAPPSAAEVKSTLNLRRTQAIAALRERVAADDEQMAQVEDIAAEMNGALHDLASELVATAQRNPDGLPSRREGMVFAVDALNILLDAEESLWGVLNPEQTEGVDPELLDPTSYIDGTIVDVMSQLDQR